MAKRKKKGDPVLSGKQLPNFPDPPKSNKSDSLDKLQQKFNKDNKDKDLAFGGKEI